MKYWLAIALVLLPITGCSGNSDMPVSVQEVKKTHEAELMATPGVVSVGVGQDENGKPVIIVGLDQPRPEAQELLPQSLDGYPVVVRIIGPIKAQ